MYECCAQCCYQVCLQVMEKFANPGKRDKAAIEGSPHQGHLHGIHNVEWALAAFAADTAAVDTAVDAQRIVSHVSENKHRHTQLEGAP